MVITDLRMPEVDGFGVLEAVKRGAAGAEVIILTASHAQDVGSAVRALRLGAHDFLAKPPSGPAEVIVTVDRALEKKRLREANLRLLRQLESLSRTDALTGALNRRAFDDSLGRERARARRYDLPLSLLLVDLDHFKRVNDTHGHLIGDEVLKVFVARAAEQFREGDSLFRYGGEEFAVLLPHTPYEGALQAARRLVARVADGPLLWGHDGLRVTVSVGVASARGEAVARLDLVGLADRALYQAKHSGRNRAVGAAGLPRRRAAA